MKEKNKYVLITIISLTIGILSTLFTLNSLGLFERKILENDKVVNHVEITEADTISKSIDKIYNSVVYIESYASNKIIGSGSGFVYKKDGKYGYILTNEHVVTDADNIKITNIDGTDYEAKLLGKDEFSDIAVLRVDLNNIMSVATIGSSEDSKLGDTIFTVGSPLGKTYMGSVTKGIISGKDRAVTLSNQYVVEVLQVDAALNPGNSGGPLANINGEVIGINSLKLVENEIEGMGFAIPIEIAKTIADKLEEGKQIERPVLGVTMLDASNTYQLYTYGIELDESIEEGAVVIEVTKDTPAYEAGLKKGDVILAINDVNVSNTAYLRSELYKYSVGDTITIKYYRDNNIKTVKVKLDVRLENS